MPTIRFDHDAADDLVRQLQATAQAVFEAAAVTGQELPATTQDWQGPHRDTFDEWAGAGLLEAQLLGESLVAAAARVRALAIEAEAAQLLERTAEPATLPPMTFPQPEPTAVISAED